MVIWREILWSQQSPFRDPYLHFSLARERRRMVLAFIVSLSNVRNVQAWLMTYEVKAGESHCGEAADNAEKR